MKKKQCNSYVHIDDEGVSNVKIQGLNAYAPLNKIGLYFYKIPLLTQGSSWMTS